MICRWTLFHKKTEVERQPSPRGLYRVRLRCADCTIRGPSNYLVEKRTLNSHDAREGEHFKDPDYKTRHGVVDDRCSVVVIPSPLGVFCCLPCAITRLPPFLLNLSTCSCTTTRSRFARYFARIVSPYSIRYHPALVGVVLETLRRCPDALIIFASTVRANMVCFYPRPCD